MNADLPKIGVLLCSRNPRSSYLTRVLKALRAQTLPMEDWELLFIDNASDHPLEKTCDLSWHPRARHLREDTPGKNNALLLGFAQSTAPILVIVDDDNVLAPDYLKTALLIASAYPRLGAWGGNVRLEFEESPPEWTQKYWTFLARQKVSENEMVCSSELTGPLPVGAGCCVRREVAEFYSIQVAKSPWRRKLGRCEDTDLVLTACDLGLQRGLFIDLFLAHLIPPERVTEESLLKLVELIQFSAYIMEMNRNPEKAPPPTNWWWWLKFCCDCATKFGRKRRFYLANKRAQRRARKEFELEKRKA